jgi:Flp pilus assembly protein TadG
MIRRFFGSERGTALVEFALVAPVLIFMMIGLIEVGRYMCFGIQVAHSARAALQYETRNLITASDAVGTRQAALVDAPNLGLAVVPSYFCSFNGAIISCFSGGSSVVYFAKVVVSGTFHSMLNYPGIPNTAVVTSTAVMRVTNQ